MSGTTWTWQPTSGTTSWETTGAGGWNGSPTFQGTDSFVINGSGLLTINGIAASAGSSDTADTVTVTDPNATLLMDSTNGPQFTVNTFNLNAGTFDLGTQGQLFLGQSGNGTLTLGGGAIVTNDNGGAVTIFSNSGASQIQGTGTILVNAGSLDINTGVTVNSGVNLDIGASSTLEVDDTVSGANFAFGGSGAIVNLTTVVNASDNISGFGATQTLDIGDVNNSNDTLNIVLSGTSNTGATLTVTDTSTSNVETFTLSGEDYTSLTMSTNTDGNGGELVTFSVCYASGTAILTDAGEVTVETLRRGDNVMTVVNGQHLPQAVTWVGHRDIDVSRHPKPETVAPVRIFRGALGDNLPCRDLVLSPDHCLFIDGGLYPAKLLVNAMTIIQDMSVKTVSYHHVELDQHSVLIAEGVPAESYLDTGNRAFFSNAGLAVILHPEMTINESLRCWEADACAPLMVKPEAVKPVWQRFADRAVAMGYTQTVHATTRNADIHLIVNGKVVRPLAIQDNTVSFMVPAGARSIRLVSRATRPSALTPWLDDPRTLGVAIRSITLRGRKAEAVLNADHPALRDGWNTAEHTDHGDFWRWSTGDAALPFVTSGPCTLEIALSETTTYIEDGQRAAA